jgi:hypothetical protein
VTPPAHHHCNHLHDGHSNGNDHDERPTKRPPSDLDTRHLDMSCHCGNDGDSSTAQHWQGSNRAGSRDATRLELQVCFYIYISFLYLLMLFFCCTRRKQRPGWLRESDYDENGPKRRVRVVWATLVSFSFNLRVLLILTILFRYYSYFKWKGWVRKVTTTKTGPNDAGRVVWAI